MQNTQPPDRIIASHTHTSTLPYHIHTQRHDCCRPHSSPITINTITIAQPPPFVIICPAHLIQVTATLYFWCRAAPILLFPPFASDTIVIISHRRHRRHRRHCRRRGSRRRRLSYSLYHPVIINPIAIVIVVLTPQLLSLPSSAPSSPSSSSFGKYYYY